MMKLLSYILTPLFHMAFWLLLFIFHPVQVVCLHLGGYHAHKRSVEVLNYLIMKSFWILGARIRFEGFDKLPQGRPLIIVANHQSTWDIPVVVWAFRKHHPKFISKIELGKGIPSISYNLRHGGSALIDRKNGGQSVKELIKLGQRIEKNNYSACIYPEGTRSKDGKVKKFQSGGVKTLMKAAPSALIVPFVIDGHHELHKMGFPLTLGLTITYRVLDPIEREGFSPEEIVEMAETRIKAALGQV